MAVTINRICGFETGDETEISASDPGIVSNSDPRTGTFSLILDSAGTDESASIDPFAAQVTDQGNDYITAFAVSFQDVTPTTASDFILLTDGVSANHVRLRIEADGDLLIIDANNSIIRTITAPFSTLTYAFLELYWQRSNSGTIELFIDGVSQGEDTAQDLLSGTGDFTTVGFGPTDTNGVTIFDDFYQISGATASSDRLGDGSLDPFFEVFGYQSDKASATPDDGGDNLDIGQWVDCGVVPFVDSSVAEYTNTAAGAVDSDATNGNPEGPVNDGRIDGTIVCMQGVWRMNRSGGGGAAHFGLMGNDVDGTTRSADFDPSTTIEGFFFMSESASIVPTTSEHCRIGFETTGGQDFQCYGQMAMLGHVPSGVAPTVTPLHYHRMMR